MNELEPQFVVTVALDGDDDVRSTTENAQAALDEALRSMQRDGLIVGYTLERPRAES